MPRTYVSQLTIAFGPATVTGPITPVQKSDSESSKPSFHYLTPDGEKPSQVYQDSAGNIYNKSDLIKGNIHDDGSFTLYDPSALEAAAESQLPPNLMSVKAHRTDDVNDYMFPSNHKAYILTPAIKGDKGKVQPNPVNDKWYDFIVTAVRDNPDLTFLSLAKVGKANDAVYRLGIYQGYLLIQRMSFPEDLNQYEPIRPQLSPVEEKKANALAHKLVSDFDITEYHDASRERLLEALNSDFDPETMEKIAQTEVEEFDLESVLDAWDET